MEQNHFLELRVIDGEEDNEHAEGEKDASDVNDVVVVEPHDLWPVTFKIFESVHYIESVFIKSDYDC